MTFPASDGEHTEIKIMITIKREFFEKRREERLIENRDNIFVTFPNLPLLPLFVFIYKLNSPITWDYRACCRTMFCGENTFTTRRLHGYIESWESVAGT